MFLKAALPTRSQCKPEDWGPLIGQSNEPPDQKGSPVKHSLEEELVTMPHRSQKFTDQILDLL